MIFTLFSTLNYPPLLEPLRQFLPYAAFLMAAFSALRLAKFNLDERQTMGFIGLPTPANALYWGALIVGLGAYLERYDWTIYVLLPMLLFSCYLLISAIPMFALKFKHWSWQGNEVKYIFLMTCIPLLGFFGLVGIAIIIAWYVALSVIVWKLGSKKQEN
jgi:CDP-diacylglycerol--serine O-phosphatidyltransferase